MSFYYNIYNVGGPDKPVGKIWLERGKVKCDNRAINSLLDRSFPYGYDRRVDPSNFFKYIPLCFTGGYVSLEKVDEDEQQAKAV